MNNLPCAVGRLVFSSVSTCLRLVLSNFFTSARESIASSAITERVIVVHYLNCYLHTFLPSLYLFYIELSIFLIAALCRMQLYKV